jgi:hypothetical protein
MGEGPLALHGTRVHHLRAEAKASLAVRTALCAAADIGALEPEQQVTWLRSVATGSLSMGGALLPA